MNQGPTCDSPMSASRHVCKRITICLFASIVLPGCIAQRGVQNVESPATLPVLASSYTATQKAKNEVQYNEFVQSGNLVGAKAMRDVIVHSVRKEIEIVYQAFESGLFAKKAAFEIETDIFELLVSTATTLTGAERARTNLSALLTATKGGRLSIDKNVFGEKTYGALVSQMRASRSKVSAKILESLAILDIAKYPLAEAELDLIQLFNAGTLHEALTQISSQAGANAKVEAQKEDDAARTNILVATDQQVKQIIAIRNRFNDLYTKKDLATARRILKALDPTVKDDLTEDDVWKVLNGHIKKAEDKNYLPTVAKAFGIAQ